MADDEKRLGDTVVFAGCCIPTERERFQCGTCGNGWGTAVL
jgi:hypothetical protein